MKYNIVKLFFFNTIFLMGIMPSLVESNMSFSDRIEEYTLDNGLKVILIEDNRSPTVVSSIWYKVGSSYEYKGISGISHVLEHMMFKGTKNTSPGEFSKKIKEVGGSENAFTGRDFTGYYQKVHKDYLELSLKLESDRMTNLIFIEEEFNKVGVKIEEFFYCPHHNAKQACLCRKPDSLLIERGLYKYNVDPSKSYFIGDKWRDVECGEKAGVKGLKIDVNVISDSLINLID